MKWILGAAAALIMLPISAGVGARAILHDSIALNIGVNCQWQSRCMAQQRSAMKHALSYVARSHPSQWRIELCNRNAARGGDRVDWIGFDHCIQNGSLRPPARATKWRRRR